MRIWRLLKAEQMMDAGGPLPRHYAELDDAPIVQFCYRHRRDGISVSCDDHAEVCEQERCCREGQRV